MKSNEKQELIKRILSAKLKGSMGLTKPGKGLSGGTGTGGDPECDSPQCLDNCGSKCGSHPLPVCTVCDITSCYECITDPDCG